MVQIPTRIMFLAALAAPLGACQPLEPSGRGLPDQLAQEIAGRIAGPAQTCVPIESQSALRIIGRQAVALDRGRTLWINRLAEACPGMREHSTLIVESHGSQYCRGDRVRTLETGSTIPGAACPLQDWTPYRRP